MTDTTLEGQDPAALARVLARVGPLDDPDHPRPLLTLEEFFEGNDHPGSIGYNLSELSSPQEMYEVLRGIRSRPGVHDARVQAQDLEGDWPSSDSVWIITDAGTDQATVMSWFPEDLAPDEIEAHADLTELDEPVEPHEMPPGTVAVLAWYD